MSQYNWSGIAFCCNGGITTVLSFDCCLLMKHIKAGMFAIRARRKVATERDFLDAVEKVVRQGTKFSSTYVVPIHYVHVTCLI